MAVTTEAVSAAAEKEGGLLNTRNLAINSVLFLIFNLFVRWYEEVYGWSAGLDAFAPEFKTYWMNWFYTELVLEVTIFSWICGYLWKTRDRDLANLAPRDEVKRWFHLLVWLVMYATAIYWGASFYTEQDGTWHQTVIRDTDFTPSHIIEFYMSYPIYTIMGMGSYMYARTRLPVFAQGHSVAFMLVVVGPFMIIPNVGLNEWGHTFWWMEELFVAPLHYGFVFFGWFALGLCGVLSVIFGRLNEVCGDLVKDQGV